MIESVTVTDNGSSFLCIIEELSDQLKDIIRDNLTCICYGAQKIGMRPKLYSYQSALKEFLKRYENKSVDTKKGMVGELLSHIMLLHYQDNLNTVSPFFNMEERSIKKGFDILYMDQSGDNQLWITEIKSGHLGTVSNSSTKSVSLLNDAKNDLKERLNEQNSQIWENAINGAMIAVSQESNIRSIIIDILYNCADEIAEDMAQSQNKNVILTSVLFNDINDATHYNKVKEKHSRILGENIFNDVIVFCIQKNTLEAVIAFLEEEANND